MRTSFSKGSRVWNRKPSTSMVAEVSVTDGKLKVHRLVLGINCGHAVNPDQVAAQMEGSVAFGLSAALYGEMSVKDGRMAQTNFDTYQLVRMADLVGQISGGDQRFGEPRG